MAEEGRTSQERIDFLTDFRHIDELLDGNLERGEFNRREIIDAFGENYEEDFNNWSYNPNIHAQAIWWRNDEVYWLPSLKYCIYKIIQLLRLLLIVQHQHGSEVYRTFIIFTLSGISQLIDQIGGIIYRENPLVGDPDFIAKQRVRLLNFRKAAGSIIRGVKPGTFEEDLQRRRSAGTLVPQPNEVNPFLQWCILYWTPTLGSYGNFVGEVHEEYNAFISGTDPHSLTTLRRQNTD